MLLTTLLCSVELIGLRRRIACVVTMAGAEIEGHDSGFDGPTDLSGSFAFGWEITLDLAKTFEKA